MACALQCSAGLAMCSACNSFAGCPACLARCFARMCTAAATSRGLRAISMQLQLAVGSSAACRPLPSGASLAACGVSMDPFTSRYGRMVGFKPEKPLRTGFSPTPRPKTLKKSPALASRGRRRGERRRGGRRHCNGDIKLVPCATPPPRRLSHEQIARGSPQDVLRAARAGKGLRRMLRAEYR